MTIGGLYDLFYLPADSQFAKAWKAECAEWSNVTLYSIHRHTFPKIPEPIPFELPTLVTIREAVCKVYGIQPDELMGKDRHKSVAQARQVFCWMLRSTLKMSFPELGKALGQHHTTCLHSFYSVDRGRTENPLMAERMSLIAGMLLECNVGQSGR